MAWFDIGVALVRDMLGDTSATPTYTDDRLQTAFCNGAYIVQQQAVFSTAYLINPSTQIIVPDPTTIPDNAFMTLSALYTTKQIFNGEMRLYSSQGIKVKDGASELDLRRNPDGLKIIIDEFDRQYQNTLFIYKMRQTQVGKAFISTGFGNVDTSELPDRGFDFFYFGGFNWGFWNGFYGGCY